MLIDDNFIDTSYSNIEVASKILVLLVVLPMIGITFYLFREYVSTMYDNPEGIYEPLIKKEAEKKAPLLRKGTSNNKRIDRTRYMDVAAIKEEEEDDEEIDPPCRHTRP